MQDILKSGIDFEVWNMKELFYRYFSQTLKKHLSSNNNTLMTQNVYDLLELLIN